MLHLLHDSGSTMSKCKNWTSIKSLARENRFPCCKMMEQFSQYFRRFLPNISVAVVVHTWFRCRYNSERKSTMRKHFTTSSYFYSWNVMSCSKILTYYIAKQTFTTTTYFWSNVISCCKSLFYYIVSKYFTTCGDISKNFQKSKAHCLM